jgi:predicted secreted protein
MKRFSSLAFILTVSAALLVTSGALANVFRTTKRLAGFSPDGSHYIYLESYRDTGPEIPLALMQIVDVRTNSCVENGCVNTEYGKDSSQLPIKAAEDDLLKRTLFLRQTFKLTYLKVGIKLPTLAHFREEDGTETVFAPLNSRGSILQVRLQQKNIPSIVRGGSDNVDRASMSLQVTANYRKLTLGSLDNFREPVLKYSIRELRLSPNKDGVVVLIDMTKNTFDGVLQTTLVQSFPLVNDQNPSL